jgi:carbonic anhydrase
MNVFDLLAERNAEFARTRFAPGMPILPALRTLVVGCVDPRVDPAHVLGTDLGETAVIRNVGGRVTPSVATELRLLRVLTESLVGADAPAIDLVLLQHTDCGITRMQDPPDGLAAYFEVDAAALPDKHVADPRAAVAADAAAVASEPALARAYRVTGVVYDVATGRIERITH